MAAVGPGHVIQAVGTRLDLSLDTGANMKGRRGRNKCLAPSCPTWPWAKASYPKYWTGHACALPPAHVCTALVALAAGCWAPTAGRQALGGPDVSFQAPERGRLVALIFCPEELIQVPGSISLRENHPNVGKGPEVALPSWRKIGGMGHVLEHLIYQAPYLKVIVFYHKCSTVLIRLSIVC